MNSKINLIHGDCLEEMTKIEPGSIDMVICDPPYGTTACKWDSIIDLTIMWKNIKRIVKKKSAIIVSTSQPFTTKVINSNIKNFKHEWVWKKNRGSNFLTLDSAPFKEHENILAFCYDGKINFYPIFEKRSEMGLKRIGHAYKNMSNTGKRDYLNNIKLNKKRSYYSELRHPSSVQEINCQVGLHPTQKPVKLYEYFIETYSKENDTVLDFCMGSGTGAIACYNLNRNFIGIEKEKKYYDLAVERLNKHRDILIEWFEGLNSEGKYYL